MIYPKDIIIRDTSNGSTVWLSQRFVVETCGVTEEYLSKKARVLYKKSLFKSWQPDQDKSEFFLPDTGAAWRWGKRDGLYYYDMDRIPNKKPVFYRDKLPQKGQLVSQIDGNNLRHSRERRAELKRLITTQVKCRIDNTDIQKFVTYAKGEKRIFTPQKAEQLTTAMAWCRYIKEVTRDGQYKELGFHSQIDFFALCAEILAPLNLEGLNVKTMASLRKKMFFAPDQADALREFLISDRYGNDNARKIGKAEIVDTETGEVLKIDAHEAVIMTYWLNPGGSQKESKKELYDQYLADMDAIGVKPVKLSTFTHYTNKWDNKVLSSRERHGRKYAADTYRPYVPAKPLEFANSLWASDGSGIVPYRYKDGDGQWRSMKLYVTLVSDVASKYIAGYSVSKKGKHTEDFKMLRTAMQMALRDNGKTEVLDFISDQHSAYTSGEAKIYLQQACRNFRTIKGHNSKGNPAECMFRLFKRRYKSFFNMAETSWDARSLESMANPDYYNIMDLPTYEQAIEKLDGAIQDWNTTKLANGLTPAAWFHDLKNPKAGKYEDSQYRTIAGEISKKDLSISRGTMELCRGENRHYFEVPTDRDTTILIGQYLGYSSAFKATIFWDETGADIYNPDGVFMFTCKPTQKTAKSASEATPETEAALGHHVNRGAEFDAMLEDYTESLIGAREVMARGYEFNILSTGTKALYNEHRQIASEAEFNRGREIIQANEEKQRKTSEKRAKKAIERAAVDYHRNKIDVKRYTKE